MGDIALRKLQVGLESGWGTAVAATRIWYGQGNIQPAGVEPTLKNEDRGSYDAYHRASVPVLDYDWMFKGGLDLDDLVEQLKLAVHNDPTPTGSGPYVWTFTPDNTLASATVEWDASGKVWEAPGAMCDSLKLSGNANGDDVTVELSGPCKQRDDSSLTGLSDHATNVVQGWELDFYVDALGGTPGTTQKDLTLISWDIEVKNNLQRKRRGTNDRYIAGLARGRRTLTGSILGELNATTLSEITNQEAVTERLLRLALGNNVIISGADKYYLYIDIPCVLMTNVIEEDAEMSVVRFDIAAIYDSTNGFMFEFTMQNNRAS
ncbi:MAG: hypothetical protein JW953_01545 [Anaerolineae bacterium]|nr:hypothetical protein [Anaerolineae bacterium]